MITQTIILSFLMLSGTSTEDSCVAELPQYYVSYAAIPQPLCVSDGVSTWHCEPIVGQRLDWVCEMKVN